MRHLIRMLLTGATALGTVTATGGGAEAAFIFTFQQQGADVVAIGNGSVDLAGLSHIGEAVLPASGVSANNAVAGVTGTVSVSVFAGVTGPGSFGPGGHIDASWGGGDAVAINGLDGFLGVPLAYVSGSALSSSMGFTNQTFASIGLKPGTYIWTWGSGSNADSLTEQIGPAAVPEPASVLMVGIGLLTLAAVRHRRGKIGTQT